MATSQETPTDAAPTPTDTSEPSAAKNPRRRWLQFSLRTLLVVFTIGALWLGWVVNKANDQRCAVEAILQAGGGVYYNYQWTVHPQARQMQPPLVVDPNHRDFNSGAIIFDPDAKPPGPDWLRELLGVDFFCDVVCVQTGYRYQAGEDNTGGSFDRRLPVMTDELMAQLPNFPELRFLRTGAGGFTDQGLAHLRQLHKLLTVKLPDSRVTDEGLRHLSHLHDLRSLDLDGSTHFTDAGLRYLHGLKKLRYVHARGTRVTEQGAKELKAALPECDIFHAPPKPPPDGSADEADAP